MIKQYLLSILLLFGIHFFSNGQNPPNYADYYKTVLKAEFHEDIDSAIYYYEVAFDLFTPFAKDAMRLANLYVKKENYFKAKKWAKTSITLGTKLKDDSLIVPIPFKTDPDIEYGLYRYFGYGTSDKKMVKFYDRNYDRWRRKFIANQVDNLNYEELLLGEKKFQNARFLCWEEQIVDSSLCDCIFLSSNTETSYLFLEILRKGEMPPRRNSPKWNEQSLGMLINHVILGFNDKDVAMEFLNLLRNLMEEGEITPREYAQAYDQYVICYIDEFKTMYGTRTKSGPDGKKIVIDLLEPEQLDSIRSEIYLPNLKDECLKYNISLPSNYKQ